MKNKLNIYIYSFLSIIGFIIPNWIVFQTIQKYGTYNFSELFSSTNANLYTQFIGADLGLAALVFIVFYILETRKANINYAWLSLVGTFLVGFSFGFSLFLLIREVNLQKENKPN